MEKARSGSNTVLSCAVLTVLLATIAISSAWAATPDGAMHSRAPSQPSQVEPDWWSRVQTNISAAEYHITWQDNTQLQDVSAAWHAPNRAHDFRIYFTDDSVRIIPRTSGQRSWEWGLSLLLSLIHI